MHKIPLVAPYGSWRSPISTNSLTTKTARLSEPQIDGDTTYWLESRPDERGRNALVTITANGTRKDILPAPHSVRTRANEYGGGSYLAAQGTIYLVLDEDQRVYQLTPDSTTLAALTPEGNYRYADFCIDEKRRRLICVREDHTQSDSEERCEIIAIPLDGFNRITVLVSGADFYSNPRVSPDGNYLSWLCWHHPQMPWDGTECRVAHFIDNGLIEAELLIAGSKTESIFQPQWSPDGHLFFVSDKNNWWNIYRWTGERVECVHELNAEFATPQWVFGMSTYGFLNADTLLCTYTQNGQWHLALMDLCDSNATQKNLQLIPCDLTDISAINCHLGRGLLLGANPGRFTTLFRFDIATRELQALASSSDNEIPAPYLSKPQAINFATSDNEDAKGFYYPPHNPDYAALAKTLPPLIVMCHGGPTGATESSLNLKIQFWTSRGFAVLDVNYRGSTGYGRAYRDRLKNNWGITDVIDVCSGADYLIKNNLADSNKIAIRGSSAGGYTVLAALTFSDTFHAGASLYGIGDLEALVQDTHKFESRYLDNLVGSYPAQKDIYQARSPIHHIDKLNCPVIFLQGLQDKVVPPNQAEAMVDALTKKGITNAHVTFAEEGHGFRHAKNIERALEAELFFYSKVFGFQPADDIAPIPLNIGTEEFQ